MNEAAPSVSASSFYQHLLQLHKTPNKKFSASSPSWEKLAHGSGKWRQNIWTQFQLQRPICRSRCPDDIGILVKNVKDCGIGSFDLENTNSEGSGQ